MQKDSPIFIAGHRGLVGSALHRALQRDGYTHLLTRTRDELDLRDQKAVESFFAENKPAYVFLAAAKVGGIMANATTPAEFIYENLVIETNIIESARESGVTKLLFLGSSCIYPKLAEQPIREESLLAGPLEPTNAPYAVAKIAGITLCEAYHRQYGSNFISVMPTNIYGPHDNFDPETSHVLPALIRKMDDAKKAHAPSVTLWGTGEPRREFLHVDDLAQACLFLMKNYDDPQIINIGVGSDISIKELASLVQKIVGFEGKIVWDSSKPDGTPQKLLNVEKLHKAGWQHSIELEEGIKMTYDWYTHQ